MLLKAVLLVFAVSQVTASQFYRRDYTYIEDFDAFYKLHSNADVVSYNAAFMECDKEGAKLFYPKQKEEWIVVKNLTQSMTSVLNTTDVILGIHDIYGFGQFVTVDGHSVNNLIEDLPAEGKNCLIMDYETGLFKAEDCNSTDDERIFVCKKIDERPCQTIDVGYQFNHDTKKCYKVNENKRTWKDAWHTCVMEGGLLSMPEDSSEAQVIRNLIKSDQRYFAGFRKIFKNGDFFTVKGEKLDDSNSYNQWYDRSNEGSDDCGNVFAYDGLRLGTSGCFDERAFVCEMPAKL